MLKKYTVILLLLISMWSYVSCVSRDDIIRQYFELGFSNLLILCFLSGIHGILISPSTLKRSLRRQHLGRRRPYLRVVGDLLLTELNHSGALLGYQAMHSRLRRKYGVRIPRDVVRCMLLAVDPVGVHLRSKHRIIRRRYRLYGPSYCWHIDGLDKLKTYGFAIHGCIDGFSRKVIWLEVAKTNNDSSVIAGYFLKAVKRYGCPRIIRCDRGSENSRIAYLQPFLRRHGTDSMAKENSFQYGRSASNQRIEAWWSVLRKWFTGWWIDFFKMLKDNGHFDETDSIQTDCLRFAFMDILQDELDDIRKMWNTHLIRKSRYSGGITGIPNELFYLPGIQGYDSYSCEVDADDVRFCFQYATRKKPLPVPSEFIS